MMKPKKFPKVLRGRRSRVSRIVPTLGLAACLSPMAGWAVLPDNLTLNVGDIDNDGDDEVIVLSKRSMRSSTNHKLLTWDSIAGYQEITPPEVRTYRGYVQDDPSMRVNANIEPGNATMNANFSDGHELNYRLTAFPVSISGPEGTYDPGTGNTVVPFVEDRVAPTANHYIVPTHHMRRLDYAVTIKNDYFVGMGSDIEAAVSRVEQRMNDTDFFYARDIGLAHEIGWMVINLEENLDSWHKEWTDVHKPNGAIYEMRGLFKKPGGAGASGDCFLGGRHTVGTLAAYSKSHGHELGHTLGAGHYSSWGDVMSGSESAIGSGTVERMIGNAAIATEAQSPALNYGGPLPPFAMEDCVTMVMNSSLDIDVLENDYDGNGDAISLSYVDATTERGGSAEIIDGKVRYTPPAHWQGVDTFVYHVVDATGIANRTGYVKVAVHNNGLATHIRLDETSGSDAYDVGPFQAHGKLDQGFSFDTNSVSGVLGNALERTANEHAKSSADFWGTGDPLDGTMSVSLWVKYQSGVPTVAGPVICKGGSVIRGRFENPRGGWTIGHTADGKFRFLGNLNRDSQYTYENPQFDLKADAAITSDTWHHLVMVMDRDTKQLRAWVDNQELSTTEFGTTIADGVIDNSHHPLVIYDSVSQQQQSTDTPVTVDDVRIYHKALSPAEVADLFNHTAAAIPAGAPSPANGAIDAVVGQDVT
ncbi:LamG-like jellyroll fold domain-containing protein [Rubritalea tangerina]|uniref:LamG-like jellyroll fold domain-containing protein n=1 Tax=Rubritalea tangerina TaxID=430798 RepID=A0ABW4Z9K6_9BACT